jgi:hypothetical protein
MPNTERPLRVYEDLANWYDRIGQAKLRDWFLVLAADEAYTRGHPADAERLRGRLLKTNPHHLLKPFASFKEALQSPDVQGYIADLRRTYPPEAAANLLITQRQAAADREARGQGGAAQPAGNSQPVSEEADGFGFQPDLGVAKPGPGTSAPRPAGAPRPPQPQKAPPARGHAQPRPAQPGPVPIPLARTPAVPPRRSPISEPLEDGATGAWVSKGLFVLLLLGSLALAAYTFVGPFLPPGWLR